MLCGDPRAWTKFRNRSTIPVTVRVAYTTGNKSKPAARKVVKRKLGVGRTTIIGQQWVRGPYKAQVLDPEKKWGPPQVVKLQAKDAGQQFQAVSNSIAVDEVHGRLYACSNRQWSLWYWDMKDGSFHGVIKFPGKDDAARPGGMGGATPGPFKGVRFYNEGTLDFGPDDPQKRFLYMAQCDDHSFYRLDLEKEIVYALDLKTGRFVDSGPARRPAVLFMLTPTWLADGSFFTKYPGGGQFYKRVK